MTDGEDEQNERRLVTVRYWNNSSIKYGQPRFLHRVVKKVCEFMRIRTKSPVFLHRTHRWAHERDSFKHGTSLWVRTIPSTENGATLPSPLENEEHDLEGPAQTENP
jgi:hypothetical protein